MFAQTNGSNLLQALGTLRFSSWAKFEPLGVGFFKGCSFDLLVLSRECGNEPRDSLNGTIGDGRNPAPL